MKKGNEKQRINDKTGCLGEELRGKEGRRGIGEIKRNESEVERKKKMREEEKERRRGERKEKWPFTGIVIGR